LTTSSSLLLPSLSKLGDELERNVDGCSEFNDGSRPELVSREVGESNLRECMLRYRGRISADFVETASEKKGKRKNARRTGTILTRSLGSACIAPRAMIVTPALRGRRSVRS